MSKALVTGARGFVGAWLAKALLEEGHNVISFDRPKPDDDNRPSTLTLLGLDDEIEDVVGDLRDREAVDAVITDHGPELVFHLAAQPIVATAATGSPVPTFEANVTGTWNVLDACRESAPRIVVASSDKAYGAHEELPYQENFELKPTAPYEASKAAADVIARSFGSFYSLPLAVTRFANIYGGGDTNWSRLIPEACTAALDGRRPVLRSDGSPERDLLYVEDAASAYLAIVDELGRPELYGEAFNAGSGRAWPVGEIVAKIAELSGTGVEPDIQGTGNPEGEIDRQWVDPSKIKRECGWEPAYSLEDGLSATLDWFREHPEVRPPA